MNQKVNDFFSEATQWQKEMLYLRSIVHNCGLTEELKWKVPCYTFGKSNILIIHGFKEYCALNFFKGALLKDTHKLLVQQTENVQSSRQIRFSSINEVIKMEAKIKAYIFEAIEIEKAGLKVSKKQTSDFVIPKELINKFIENSEFEKAFNKLTEGRKRGYFLHFNQPKQSKTRISRIEKNMNRIFDGKGLNDCICGLSKRMPNCDGSHKQLNK